MLHRAAIHDDTCIIRCFRKIHVEHAAQAIANWATAQTYGDLPEEVKRICVRAILDTIGVAVAGSATFQAKVALEYANAEYGAGAASLIGSDHRLSLRGAAFVNGVAAHALDFDDTCYAGICHGSATILPAVLACAQSHRCSGRELIRAFAVASEITYALGDFLGDDIYYRGWFTSILLGSVGAAAGASAILELDDQAMAGAIANALAHCGGARSVLGSSLKAVLAGQASALGIESARLAAAGVCAGPDALEHRFGIVALTGAEPLGNHDKRLALGKPWRLVKPGLAVKQYPVCSAAQAAVEAVLSLVRSNCIDSDSVASVECLVPRLVAISLPYHVPRSTSEAQFSLPFCVACALVHGGVEPSHLNASIRDDPRIADLISRVRITTLEDSDPLATQLRPEGTKVLINTKAGDRFDQTVPKAFGMPERPLPDETLDEKFLACISTIGIDGEAMLNTLRNLPDIKDVSSMMTGMRYNENGNDVIH